MSRAGDPCLMFSPTESTSTELIVSLILKNVKNRIFQTLLMRPQSECLCDVFMANTSWDRKIGAMSRKQRHHLCLNQQNLKLRSAAVLWLQLRHIHHPLVSQILSSFLMILKLHMMMRPSMSMSPTQRSPVTWTMTSNGLNNFKNLQLICMLALWIALM